MPISPAIMRKIGPKRTVTTAFAARESFIGTDS
jgi:hypothetical protein